LNSGHVGSLEKITIDEIKEFYRSFYTLDNLILGVSGDYSDEFINKLSDDLARKLAPTQHQSIPHNFPLPSITNIQVTIIQKETRATAISSGFPIDVTRFHKDFPALWLARSYLGEHRSFSGLLMNRMREIRGLNYGDYAYNEYFPYGMTQFHPDPNLARYQQIFQIWIRPVPPNRAHYAIRLAKYELDKLVSEGIAPEKFDNTRQFLLKFMHVLVKTQDAKLGYAIDSEFYNLPEFTTWMQEELKKLTVEETNRVVRKYLDCKNNFHIVAVTKDAGVLRDQLLKGDPSPITYDADRPKDILEEDKIVSVYPLPVLEGNVVIVPLEVVFT